MWCAIVVLGSILLASISEADAQTFEAVGTRALGMGGAFVAVADDSSAVYWNPAGLAAGPFFELRFEHLSADKSSEPQGAQFFALSVPVMALSYYRLRNVGADPQSVQLATTAQSVRDREIQGPVRPDFGSLTTHHFGLTLVQSISDRFVAATTVRGILGTLGGSFDVDAGAMALFGPARAGVVVRNVRAASFETAQGSGFTAHTMGFKRQVRVGVALIPDQGRRANPTAVALDVDLTTQIGLRSERRNVAVGVEQWLMNRRVGVRGGVRASTLGDARPIVAGGASVLVRASVFVDGHVSQGNSEQRSWSVAARVSF